MKQWISVLALVLAMTITGCAGDEGFFESGGGGGGGGALILNIDAVEPAEAAPGDEVLLVGTGLDAERDTVVAGNLEVDPTVGIDFALSKITSDEESDAVDGQIRFTIPEDAEPGELPIKVVRGDIESNVVTVTVSQGGGSLNLMRPIAPTLIAPPGSALAVASVGTMSALNYVVGDTCAEFREFGGWTDQDQDGDGVCRKPIGRLEEDDVVPEAFSILEFTWQLPAGATDATLYAPVRGQAIRQRRHDGDEERIGARWLGVFFETDFNSAYAQQNAPFTNTDRDHLAGLIASHFDEHVDAANYDQEYIDAYEKCFDAERGDAPSIPLTCKPIPVTAQAGSVRTPVLVSPEYLLDGFKHAVLEYTDADGNVMQAFADIPR